jgi:hypothetical protein
MSIDKSNIEAYLLDYLEGNLDALLTAELMAFLSENPEYEKWLPEYDGLICLSGGPVFEDKQSLKKEFSDIPAVTAGNFDEFCIAAAEGLLHIRDLSTLKAFLKQHPEKQADYDRYVSLKLQPDLSVKYPGKANLKKPVIRYIPGRYFLYVLGAAASIALLFMLLARKPEQAGNPGALTSNPTENTTVSARPGQSVPPAPEGNPSRPVSHRNKVTDARHGVPQVSLPEQPGDPDRESLAVLEPIPVKLTGAPIPQPPMAQVFRSANQEKAYDKSIPANTREDQTRTPLQLAGAIVKKLNIWKAAETAVSGFNYLTESQVSLIKTTDEHGKLTSLGLATPDYTIEGNKIK